MKDSAKDSDKQEATPESPAAEGGEAKPEEKVEETPKEEKSESKDSVKSEPAYKTVEDVKKQWRKFAIDLMPKV